MIEKIVFCMTRKFLNILLVLVLEFIIMGKVIAETVEYSEVKRFKSIIDYIYKEFESSPRFKDDISVALKFLNQECDIPNPEKYKVKELKSNADEVSDDFGLELRGRFTSNSTQGADANDVSNPSNGYIELSWRVLKNGWKENRHKAKKIYKEAELEELISQSKEIVRKYGCRNYNIDKAFSGKISKVLVLKLRLLEAIYPIERRSYLKNWSQFNDFVVSSSELTLARHELNFLHSSPYYDDSILEVNDLPDIDIDMESIIIDIRKKGLYKKYTELQKEILSQQKLAEDDNQLRFFIRDRFITNKSIRPDNIVFGMNFIIPFTYNNEKTKTNAIHVIKEQEKLKSWERLVKVREAYGHLRYQQKQLIKQRARQMRAIERIRQTMAKLRISDDNSLLPIAAARLRTALDATLELEQSRLIVYKRILQVFQAAEIDIEPKYIRLFTSGLSKDKARFGKRSLYIWSKSFNKHDNKFIEELIKAKGFNEVMLSLSKKTNRNKFNSFIRNLGANPGFKATIVVGSNEWVLPKNHQRAVINSAVAVETTQRIHLDIEPHALKKYHISKRELIDNYIQMIKKIRKSIGKSFMSVSVPIYWSPEVYKKLNNYVDKFYLMAYGKNEENIANRIISIAKSIPSKKITIALNLKDYNDIIDVQNRVVYLYRVTSIDNYAFHSMSSFLKLIEGN